MSDVAGSAIRVILPADTRFIALTRVMAASLGAELRFSVDEIEGLRLGMDELASLVIEIGTEAGIDEVELRYRLTGDGLEVEACVDRAVDFADAGGDGLTTQILDAAVDTYHLGVGRASIAMRRTGP